jgi:hypothetical protein
MTSSTRLRREKSGAEMKTGARRAPAETIGLEQLRLTARGLTMRPDQIHDLDIARIRHFRIRQHLQLRQAAAQEAREHRP